MSQKRYTAADERHFLGRTLAAEFRDEQVLAPHAHPSGQLIYSVSGVMSVWTEQGSWVAPPHWAVWAPAGIAHGMRFTGAVSLRTLYLRPGLAGLAAKTTGKAMLSVVPHVSAAQPRAGSPAPQPPATPSCRSTHALRPAAQRARAQGMWWITSRR